MLYSQLYNAGVAVFYQLNYNYYQELCENKDRPELHCNGTCVLSQQLAQRDQQHEPSQEPPIVEINFRLFTPPLFTQHLTAFSPATQSFYSIRKSSLPPSPFNAISTPPPRF